MYAHFVAQFYIRNFGINKKQTARFDKTTGQKIVVSIESFCRDKDYFAFDKESLVDLPWYMQWIYKDSIENLLSSDIEGPVSSILETLIAKRTLEAISESNIRMLLEWAAWMFIANPHSLAIRSIETVTDQYKDIDPTKLSKIKRLKIFTDLHEKITPIFLKRGWILQLIDPNHGPLLSCDRPVMIAGKSLRESSQLSDQTIIFPISPRLALIGNNNPVWGWASKPLESRSEASLMMNILTFAQSHRFIFGASMNDIDNLFKSINK